MTQMVGIYLYDEVEVLDFSGPFEVFNTAARLAQRAQPGGEPLFQVCLIADQPRTVRARGGLSLQVGIGFANHPRLDVLLIPGGVHLPEMERSAVIDGIRRTGAKTPLVSSVCTGAFLLARAGLLEGRQVTTHWEDIPDLRAAFPSLQVLENARWVDADSVVTSAGISAGMDMSLHLVERLAGRDLAVRTARQMEYDWREA